MSDRTGRIDLYETDEGYALRWKRHGKRLVVKLPSVAKERAKAEAIAFLTEALGILQADAAKA